MTILIAGGASQTGVSLAHLLVNAGHKVVFASRSGKGVPNGFGSAKLDWEDPSTYETPFTAGPFESTYIVGHPISTEPAKFAIPFIEIAVKKGVKKFVYLSAALADKDHNGGGLGTVPKYLKENGLPHVIIRPTWFIDNLPTSYFPNIKTKGEIESVIPTGRLPFVAVEDIAKAAFEGLTNEEYTNKDIISIGPELLTYDELAEITSDVLGRKITHRVVSPEEWLEIKGLWAKWLVEAEQVVEKGGESKWWDLPAEEQERQNVKVIKGKTTARQWVESNKGLFE